MGLGHDIPFIGVKRTLRPRGPTSLNGPEADLERRESSHAILEVFLFVLEFVFLVDLVALFVPRRLRFAAAERSRYERLARSIGIALRRPRGDLLARDRGRLADRALAGAAHQVNVDVIVVIGIGEIGRAHV